MEIVGSIIIFCSLSISSLDMTEAQYEKSQSHCRNYISDCIGRSDSEVRLNYCADAYNRDYYPARECRNDMGGLCL